MIVGLLLTLCRLLKERGEAIGLVFIILGIGVLVTLVVLAVSDLKAESWLLGAFLGLLSVGLGFTALGMAAKADKRHTELLERLDKNVERLPVMFRGDILTPTGQLWAKEMLSEQSREAAQKRLDEDTERVGYVRGELFQKDDGSWVIHWGGKYPL